MKGTNPQRSITKGSGETLEIKEIFKTFQGEGPFVGYPAIFIRLGGCNLACNFCDTMFEDFIEMPVSSIIELVNMLAGNTHKVAVITGGEPFRQPINLLCEKLIEEGFTVQIETNGTIFHQIPDAVHIVCSPKNPNGKYAPIRPDLLARASCLKFLVSTTEKGYQEVPELGQTAFKLPVYVQPMDEEDQDKNKENARLALEIAESKGYRISLQTHKILNIR